MRAGKVRLYCFMNLLTLLTSSPEATAITTNPFSLNCLYNFSIEGISSLHGPHHVAQKFSITTLPLKSFKLTFLFVISFNVKSFASWREDNVIIKFKLL